MLEIESWPEALLFLSLRMILRTLPGVMKIDLVWVLQFLWWCSVWRILVYRLIGIRDLEYVLRGVGKDFGFMVSIVEKSAIWKCYRVFQEGLLRCLLFNLKNCGLQLAWLNMEARRLNHSFSRWAARRLRTWAHWIFSSVLIVGPLNLHQSDLRHHFQDISWIIFWGSANLLLMRFMVDVQESSMVKIF